MRWGSRSGPRGSDWDDAAAQLRDFRHIGAGSGPGGVLTRLRITASGRVVEETICELLGEFPHHDVRRTGRRHRYSYYAAGSAAKGVLQVVTVDHLGGDRTGHVFTEGDVPGEPIFVPRTQGSDEDDGFVLCLVYHSAEHRTALHVLDARHLDAPPLASARLPHHAFPGFHGSFTTRIARG